MDESKIKMNVLGITHSQVQPGAYALLLSQANGPYRIPIVIGTPEAQSIAMRLEGVTPPRPLTHDLIISLMHAFSISIEEVVIYNFSDGVFSSHITLNNGERQVQLDARTSDAIALALRAGAPIYTTSRILQQTGFQATKQDDEQQRASVIAAPHKVNLEDMPIERLRTRLKHYVDREEYERAAEVQKVINAKLSNEKQESQNNAASQT